MGARTRSLACLFTHRRREKRWKLMPGGVMPRVRQLCSRRRCFRTVPPRVAPSSAARSMALKPDIRISFVTTLRTGWTFGPAGSRGWADSRHSPRSHPLGQTNGWEHCFKWGNLNRKAACKNPKTMFTRLTATRSQLIVFFVSLRGTCAKLELREFSGSFNRFILFQFF